jgi:hypothetical protein
MKYRPKRKKGKKEKAPSLFPPPCDENSGALFSEDRAHRYKLWRVWDKEKTRLMVVGLNPSKADEVDPDNTITRLINFAKEWGHGGLLMGNLFALVSTKPKALYGHENPIGDLNDLFLQEMADEAVKSGGIIVCAWGRHGSLNQRDEEVISMFTDLQKHPLHCFGRNKDGTPTHPLYLPSSSRPIDFARP